MKKARKLFRKWHAKPKKKRFEKLMAYLRKKELDHMMHCGSYWYAWA